MHSCETYKNLLSTIAPQRIASIDDDDFVEYDVTEHRELMHGIPEHFAQKSGPIYIDPETIDSEEDEIVNYPQCTTGQICSDVVFFDVVNFASFKRCRFSALPICFGPPIPCLIVLAIRIHSWRVYFLSRVGFKSLLLVFIQNKTVLFQCIPVKFIVDMCY